MRGHISKNHVKPETSVAVSKGVYTVLVLPWFIAISVTIALFQILVELGRQQDVDSFVAISFSTILILPIILVLSLGMFWSVKNISERMVNISNFKPVGFGTVIKLWLSYLSKLHLLWFGFYILLGIIGLIVMQFVPLDDVYHGIAEQLGIPAQAGITIIFFIGFLAYIVMFGGMAYVLGTLPLALFSAVVFRCFTRIKPAI